MGSKKVVLPKSIERHRLNWRDEARAIVAKDRDLRKFGVSTNTSGEIARAMERAYKLGLQDARPEAGSAELPELSLAEKLPPRAKAVLLRIGDIGIRLNPDDTFKSLPLLQRRAVAIFVNWVILDERNEVRDSWEGDQTMKMLITRGLLTELTDKGFWTFSQSGIDTYFDLKDMQSEE